MVLIDPSVFDNTFTAYQKRGYEFNILMSINKDVRPWLLTKYCNCLYGKSERSKFDFVVEDGEWFLHEDVFIIDIIRVRKKLELPLQNNLFNIIINRLDNKAYVYGYFDEYYISRKRRYQKSHYRHSFLIYGYDINVKQFYAIGYTKDSKYEKYLIPFEEFYNALTSLNKIELTFVTVNSKFSFIPKIESIYYGIYDYIHSIRSVGLIESNVIYGIDTLYELVKEVKQTVSDGLKLDLRYSKFYMEFKHFMFERLEYLYSIGYIDNEYKEYSEVCQTFDNIHMLFLKYNITYDPVIAERIIQMIEDATNIERKILKNVLKQLIHTLIEKNSINYI